MHARFSQYNDDDANVEAQFDIAMQDGIPVVHIKGDLDHANTPHFRSIISDLINKGYKRMILEMSGVTFMDSGGMSGVIFAAKQLHSLGGHLSLSNCNSRITRKLDIGGLSKLTSILTIHSSIEQAIDYMQKLHS